MQNCITISVKVSAKDRQSCGKRRKLGMSGINKPFIHRQKRYFKPTGRSVRKRKSDNANYLKLLSEWI